MRIKSILILRNKFELCLLFPFMKMLTFKDINFKRTLNILRKDFAGFFSEESQIKRKGKIEDRNEII